MQLLSLVYTSVAGPQEATTADDTVEAVWLECVAEALRNPTVGAFNQVDVCCEYLTTSGAPAFELVLSSFHTVTRSRQALATYLVWKLGHRDLGKLFSSVDWTESHGVQSTLSGRGVCHHWEHTVTMSTPS